MSNSTAVCHLWPICLGKSNYFPCPIIQLPKLLPQIKTLHGGGYVSSIPGVVQPKRPANIRGNDSLHILPLKSHNLTPTRIFGRRLPKHRCAKPLESSLRRQKAVIAVKGGFEAAVNFEWSSGTKRSSGKYQRKMYDSTKKKNLLCIMNISTLY